MASSEGRFNPVLVVGVLAIVVGSLVMLDHAGYIHAGNLWRFWPVILIIFGLNGLLSSNQRCRTGNIIGNGSMLIWGCLLLAASFGYLAWTQMWPIFLIAFGGIMIWEALRAKPQNMPLTSGIFHPEAVFSSIEKTITDQDFKAGSASAIFGSVELDFIQANMAGDAAVLELNAVFGSIEVRVPLSWNITIEAGAVFGTCENKTRGPIPGSGAPKTLIVRGGAVFGSIEIKN